jgi:hypothetical protein
VAIDNGYIALGSLDTMPGVSRQDGPDVSGVEFRLVRLDADGSLIADSNVRVRGEDVVLLGATDTTAYLERGLPGVDGAVVVARDLSTGAESPLATVPVWSNASDIYSGKLAIAGSDSTGACRLVLVDLASAEVSSPPDNSCAAVQSLRFSPDGAQLAVIHGNGPGTPTNEVRLSVRDVASGSLINDWHIGNTGPYGDPDTVCGAATCELIDVGGATWLTDGSIEVAVLHHPDNGDLRSLDLATALDALRFG